MLIEDVAILIDSRRSSALSDLQRKLSEEADLLSAKVAASIAASRVGEDAGLSRGSKEILAIERAFQAAVDASDYYPTLLAFVGSFAEQIDDFELVHEHLPPARDLLTEEDSDALSDQVAAAALALETKVTSVQIELRQFLSRSLGDADVSELVQRTCAIVRRVSEVMPIAKDQWNTWFRLLSSLAFKRAEERGLKLRYAYVGLRGRSTRKFCARLSSRDDYTLDEVSSMSNGQVGGALVNGGGYGCDHVWIGEAR
jgi:hypothetical protein